MRRIQSIINKAVSGLLLTLNISFAAQGSPEQALELMRSIEVASGYQNNLSKSIVLPVSHGFHQGGTCLCWSYAFFSALETLYLVKHPGENMTFSRGAMQYINLEDRIDLKIAGIEDHLDPAVYQSCWSEGGTPLSADYIIKNYGAVPVYQYYDVVTAPDYSEIYYSVFSDTPTTPKEKRALAEKMLEAYFDRPLPETVSFQDKNLSRLAFVRAIAPEGQWQTFAISKNDEEHTGPGLDSDARRNEQTHFISRAKLIQLFTRSFEEQKPVILTSHGHVVLIYGVDFGNDDMPETVYIKDSYQSHYFYKADFGKVLNEMLEMTMLVENK